MRHVRAISVPKAQDLPDLDDVDWLLQFFGELRLQIQKKLQKLS